MIYFNFYAVCVRLQGQYKLDKGSVSFQGGAGSARSQGCYGFWRSNTKTAQL